MQTLPMLIKYNQRFSIRVQGRGNHPQPSGLEYRNEDQSVVFETDENGFLMNIERMVEVPSQGELCLLVDGALIPKQKDKVASMSLQFNFPFLPREAGDYPVSILREGMQDGGRIMKSVAPRGLGFMVPTLKTLIIRPMEKGGALPKVVLLKQDKPLSKHQPVVIGRSIYITTSTLKKSKADLLKIDGPYEMSASFKVDLNELAKLEKERAASNAQ